MKILALAAALALAGCTVPTPPPPPAAVSNATTLDEKVATGFELAYTAAALAAQTARKAGVISDARWPQVKALDARAYQALQGVRAAYRAGNATDYARAAVEVQVAISAILGAIR